MVETRVGIRVDADERVGLGHLVRMLVLARVLKRKFRTWVFFYTQGGTLVAREVRRAGFPVRLLPRGSEEARARAILPLLARDHIERLIIDLQAAISVSVAQILKEGNAGLILLDDLGPARKLADLTINAIDHMSYTTSVQGPGRVLEGPRYMILGEEYARVPPARIRKEARSVLLSFGGSDRANLTEWTLRALLALTPKTQISCLLGPAYPHQIRLRAFIKERKVPVRLIKRTNNLASLFSKFDLVFTHFGITVYELARLGVPTVLIHPTRYHDSVARVFSRCGSVLNLGFWRDLTHERVRRTTTPLLEDYQRRVRMARSGRRIVDGQGAMRVARLIVSL